jgi:serine/threonine-protein kinase
MPLFGKYEILGQLGKGTVGAVYRARDTMLEREIALKLLHEIHAGDPELKERFYREARSCARLRHPGVVVVHDFGETDGIPYMVMELLAGQDLKSLLAAGRRPPPRQALELMAQVSEALGHAHAAGIVHRDVKPSNIFVQEGGAAKVLDFGIARLAASELTRVGRALGTPDYMAPEQILGRTCDARSDLFSAAIVAFELLTGTHPFRGDSIPRRIVQGQPESLLAVAPGLPASLEEVFGKALEKEPERRYQTGEEFAAALRRAAGEAGSERPDELEALFHHAAQEPEARTPPPQPVDAGDFGATRIIPRPPAPPARKSGKGLVVAAVLAAVAVGAGAYFALSMRKEVPAAARFEPAVATARVAADRTEVYDVPSAAGRRVSSLARDETVDVVRLPRSVFQEWVAVRSGYVRQADLGNWSSREAGPAFTLLEVFAPAEHEGAQRISEQIGQLDAFLGWAGGRPEAARARLEKAALNLLLAREERARGVPLNEWRGHLERAGAELPAAEADAKLKAPAARVRQALEAMRPAPVQTPEVPRVDRRKPAPVYRAALSKVESLWKRGLYADAMSEVNLFLAQNPNHESGRAWRERIERAQRLEGASPR